MTIKVAAFCTYLTSIDQQWRSEDYAASNMVKAIKGKPLVGQYSHVPVLGRNMKLTETNRLQAFSWFGAWGWEKLSAQYPEGEIALVPIPSSDALVGTQTNYTALRLANEVAGRSAGRAVVVDAFRWRKRFPPAHQGGTRDADTLYGNLVGIASVPPGRTPVLVDDVLTQGGHFKACARRLLDGGDRARFGVVVGRTSWDQPQRAFAEVVERLDEVDAEVPAYSNYLVSVSRLGVRGQRHHGFGSLWMPIHRRGDFTGMVGRCRDRHSFTGDFSWGMVTAANAAFFVELVDGFFADNRFMLHHVITRTPLGAANSAWATDPHLAVCFDRLLQMKMRFLASGREPEAFHLRLSLPDNTAGVDEWLSQIQSRVGSTAVKSVFDRRYLDNPFVQLADLTLCAVIDQWEGNPLNPGQIAVRDAVVSGLGWEQWGDLCGGTDSGSWKFNIWSFPNPNVGHSHVTSRPVKHYKPFKGDSWFRGGRS